MPEVKFPDPKFPIPVETVGGCCGANAPAQGSDPDPLDVIGGVLGWRVNPTDARGIRNALASAFPIVTNAEGKQVASYVPRLYGTRMRSTGDDVVSEWQNALADRAQRMIDVNVPKIEHITSSACCERPEDVEPARNLVVAQMKAIAEEMTSSAPLFQRIDQGFDLLGAPQNGVTPAPGSLLYLLETSLKLSSKTNIDVASRSAFTSVVSEISDLRSFYKAIDRHLPGGDPHATDLRRIEAGLTCVADAVEHLYSILDSVYVGPDQRATIDLAIPGERSMTLAELLSWIADFTGREGLEILRSGGIDAVPHAIGPTVSRLAELLRSTQDIFSRSITIGQTATKNPEGLRTERVATAFEDLVTELDALEASTNAGKNTSRLAAMAAAEARIPVADEPAGDSKSGAGRSVVTQKRVTPSRS